MKTLYYKFLVLFYYYIGDFLCRLNFQWSFDLYQKSMTLSYDYDEKIDFQFWKKPSTINTNL
jgi:hypothetical protein